MGKKLGELVEIKSGYTLRKRVDDYNPGNIYMIQVKDLGYIREDRLSTIDVPTTGHILQEGDVLLAIRGNFQAVVFPGLDKEAIAASSIMVLRPTTDKFTPQYLALYLNSPKGRDLLSTAVTGGTIPALTKSGLQVLPMPLPSIEMQRKLIELNQNIKQQQKLGEYKYNLLQKLIDGVTKSAVTGAIK